MKPRPIFSFAFASPHDGAVERRVPARTSLPEMARIPFLPLIFFLLGTFLSPLLQPIFFGAPEAPIPAGKGECNSDANKSGLLRVSDRASLPKRDKDTVVNTWDKELDYAAPLVKQRPNSDVVVGSEERVAQASLWQFARYVPSEWEQEWTEYVNSGEYKAKPLNHHLVCGRMKKGTGQLEKAEQMLKFVANLSPGASSWRLSYWKDLAWNGTKPKRGPEEEDMESEWDPSRPKSIWTRDVGTHPLMSKLVYSVLDPSSKERTEFAAYIEPLVGHLRHPYHCIKHNFDLLLDTSYLLFDRRSSSSSEKAYGVGDEAPSPPRPFTTMYFDLGATLFPKSYPNFEAWGSSQGYFPALYAQLGLPFDSLSLWEIKTHVAANIFRNVPPNLLGNYQYFNIPVARLRQDGKLGEWNAIKVLRGKVETAERQFALSRQAEGISHKNTAKGEQKGVTGSPEIYVVFKLDIDSPDAENGVVERLMEFLPGGERSVEDPIEVHEFLFEHHTNLGEVVGPKWCPSGDCPSVAESFAMFQIGRAHV
jgi:hypothetical protein